ncbi:hypothetical protein [Roseinatronobacter alkalisoli]|uniref:Uncharacterized protein n=1 Tax=Roseinatronobacter alkalisoli TaxID=3028235 RepID=A0ABT5T8D8_9RHOB|nr:hypothetical protein [Roseinatronobacter sp. HJB301]MDD7971398.1 hypothetical protein [Roseinatronobacter sp. HJB301]
MSFLRFCVRSFHPRANFGASGLGYSGDDRGFSYSLSVTSRIYAIVRIDLINSGVFLETVDSDESSWLFGLFHQDYSQEGTQPTANLSGQVDPYLEDGDQSAQLLLSYRGQNFAMPMGNSETARELVYESSVPDLDVICSLHLTIDRDDRDDRDDRKMSFALRMTGDGFPNAEAFIIESAEQPLMLATHRRVGSALAQLRGNRRIAMAVGIGEIECDDDKLVSALSPFVSIDYAEVTGGPIDVLQETGISPNNRADWNLMHTSKRDARGGWGRRYLGDNTPIFAPGRRASSMP